LGIRRNEGIRQDAMCTQPASAGTGCVEEEGKWRKIGGRGNGDIGLGKYDDEFDFRNVSLVLLRERRRKRALNAGF
jgi:hypothetical protein